MDKKLKSLWLVKVLGLCLLYLMTATAQAEIQYVGDTLRVGVRAEPNRSLPSIVVIETGAAVEVLERKQGFLHIRTGGGIEGWVKSSYLSSRKPAKLILDEARKEQQALQAELERLRAEMKATPQQDNHAAMQALQIRLDKLAKENHDLRVLVAGDTAGEDNSWLYWFSGILAVGPLGFLLGLLWYRYQIMKKLGGLTL